jgi:hypothetical protein
MAIVTCIVKLSLSALMKNGTQASLCVRNQMLVGLRGGGGELGNLKPYPMVSLFIHKDKLEHTI